jgi:hypothetical protein
MAARKQLLTTEDVADILGVAPQTVANWRQSGRHKLPHLKIDRLVRYDPAAVDCFLANSEVVDSDEDFDDDEFEDYESDDDFDDDADDDVDEDEDDDD